MNNFVYFFKNSNSFYSLSDSKTLQKEEYLNFPNEKIISASISDLGINTEFLIIMTKENIKINELNHLEKSIILKGQIFESDVIEIKCLNNFIITKNVSGFLNCFTFNIDDSNEIDIKQRIDINNQPFIGYIDTFRLFSFNDNYLMIDICVNTSQANMWTNSLMYTNSESNFQLKQSNLNLSPNEYVTCLTDFDNENSSIYCATSIGNIYRLFCIYDDDQHILEVQSTDLIYKSENERIEKISKKNKTNYLIAQSAKSIHLIFFEDMISLEINNFLKIHSEFEINHYQEFFEKIDQSFVLLIGEHHSQISCYDIDENTYKIIDFNSISRFLDIETDKNEQIM